MNLQPINPYHIIEELTKEVAQLKEENEELKKLIPVDEEETDE